MKINISTRHAKIIGDFTEQLILYWLSKYGFECALVDHTGIDIIAANPNNNERMGISVKGRTRKEGTENDGLNIPKTHLPKITDACNAFGCVPYIAIAIDRRDEIIAFITTLEHFLKLCPEQKNVYDWKMSPKHLEQYAKDPEIKSFKFKHETTNWWPGDGNKETTQN